MVATDENRRQAMQKGKIPLEKLAKHFETYNRSEGKSPKTVVWYSSILRYLGDYLKAQGLPDDLDHLKVDVVREFILHLQTKKKWDGHPGLNGGGHLRAISVQTYVRGVKGFFGWLQREGYTEENRLAHLKPPKAPKTLAEVLTDEEVRRILAFLNPETPTGCRDRAVLITLLDTGLRLSEVAGIRMADVHIDEGYLKVMGKGAKERIVPMGGLAQSRGRRLVLCQIQTQKDDRLTTAQSVETVRVQYCLPLCTIRLILAPFWGQANPDQTTHHQYLSAGHFPGAHGVDIRLRISYYASHQPKAQCEFLDSTCGNVGGSLWILLQPRELTAVFRVVTSRPVW